MDRKAIAIVFTIVISFLMVVVFSQIRTPSLPPPVFPQRSTIDILAKCLTQKGFKMYGTDNCPACQQQRSYFGESFGSISYIDCDKNQQLCQTKNVRSYPTWEDISGKKYRGAILLDKLAELSGCTKSQ